MGMVSDETYTLTDELKFEIIERVKRVLTRSHLIAAKQEVIDRRTRLQFACPYCGDSTKDHYKKRGNIYWADAFFHCYNCGHHESVDSFLNSNNEGLRGNDRISIINYIQNNKSSFEPLSVLDFDLYSKLKEISISVDEIAELFMAKKITPGISRGYVYLKERLLHNNLEYFLYNSYRKCLVIMNLVGDNKVSGVQVRHIDDDWTGPKYISYGIEKIYSKLNKPLELDADELEKLNAASTTFGLLRVNMQRDFTVFEGPIDSFFMKNSIALTGASKQTIDFSEVPTVRFLFDFDKDGQKKMREKLREGFTVFLWDKLLIDFPEIGIDKRGKQKNKIDLNDLVIYEYNNKKGVLRNLDKYFSNNPLDLVYV